MLVGLRHRDLLNPLSFRRACLRNTRLALSILLLICPCYLPAKERPIESAHSRITMHVGKTGLFSAAGHEHEGSAPIAEAGSMIPTRAMSGFESRPKMTVLSERGHEAVQSAMQSHLMPPFSR